MTTESIVVSLEWAKKLKEAGFPQNCYFCWDEHLLDTGHGVRSMEFLGNEAGYSVLVAAAPTAEEILRRLPSNYQILKHDDCWCGYKVESWMPVTLVVEKNSNTAQESLANAAAAMFCYLAEQKLLPQSV